MVKNEYFLVREAPRLTWSKRFSLKFVKYQNSLITKQREEEFEQIEEESIL
jgi:hypothetical protein